jgi:hypothetical protein
VAGMTRVDSLGQQVVLDLHVVAGDRAFCRALCLARRSVPGVVQVDWAVHFARQYLPLEGAFLGAGEPQVSRCDRAGCTRLQLSLAWDAAAQEARFLATPPRSENSRSAAWSLALRNELRRLSADTHLQPRAQHPRDRGAA